jgi:glycosyltransferase involved in cell wall biosynthesis
VVPNKGHVHLLRAFAAYRRTVDPGARLFVVGSWGPPPYMDRLFRLREALGAESVAFTGAVAAPSLVAHYRAADAFVCLSEHEGYGIPLVEAMRFDVPVIAYDAGAVAETLGDAGVLLGTLDARYVAEIIGRVAGDPSLRARLVERQRARMADLEALPRDELQVEAITRAIETA